MKKKLTLSLDQSVKQQAKIYAKKKNSSLSELVENYFKVITDSEMMEDSEISPNVLELCGIIKLPENFDYKADRLKYLEKKYLRD